MRSGSTPPLFHTVLPWCKRMPATRERTLAKSSKIGVTRSGGHRTYTSFRKRAQLFSGEQLWLPLLPWRRVCQWRRAKVSEDPLVLLFLLASQRDLPRPTKCSARVLHTRDARKATMCVPPASVPTSATWPAQHMVVNADFIHAEDCGRRVSVAGCPQHVADTIRPSPDRQSALKWCAFLVELSCELFRKCPGDQPPH